MNNHLKIYTSAIIIVVIIIIVCAIILHIMKTKSEEKSTSSGNANHTEFNSQCLKAHNNYRKKHGVSDLITDKKLIDFANSRAFTLKETDVFEHSKGNKYGENLHYISPDNIYECNRLVNSWYDEVMFYNYEFPWLSLAIVGHFTQIVWKSSLKVGCAQSYSKASKRLYSVCNYDPPGNYFGQEKKNVLRPSN